MNVFALGGGDLLQKETLEIDRLIAEETGKARPNALFVPTASEDDPEYVAAFFATYRDELACAVDALQLWRTDDDPAEKIAWADLIYVGGGNTRKMLAKWRETGVDQMLLNAAQQGTILSGLSAGANCWFRYCNSDWPMMEGRTDILTARLDGLAFFDFTFCPHMKQEEFRPAEFTKMMADTPGVGIGVDDHCAFHIRGDQYRVLACRPNSRAHRLECVNGSISDTRLEPDGRFRSLADLLSGNP